MAIDREEKSNEIVSQMMELAFQLERFDLDVLSDEEFDRRVEPLQALILQLKGALSND